MTVAMVAVAIILGVVVFVLWPVLRNQPDSGDDAEGLVRELTAERHVLVESLRELELDLELGKLEEAHYAQAKAALERRLADVLAQLEPERTGDVKPTDSTA